MKSVIRKMALMGLFYYCVVLINACCHCETDNIHPFEFTDLWTQNEEYQVKGDSSFSKRSYSGDSIRSGAYGLGLYLEPSYVFNGRPDMMGPLMNTAYACKCKTGYDVRDSMLSIEIITLNDFDEQHGKGSDVTHFFVQLMQNNGAISEFPANKDLEDHNFIPDIRGPVSISLYLKKSPTQTHELRFDVRVHFRSGKTMSYFSRPVILI